MTDDQTPADRTPRRRPWATTALAAGALGGLLLGVGGVAFAADDPATSAPPSASTPRNGAAEDGAGDDELCDEPGGGRGGPAGPDASDGATSGTDAGSDDAV